ncbi:SRPBCC domain-containing protein [Streptomyces tricolor]|uniref:SRPBCC domain-containing protein n=1 Tax=Streptomyces tricolor TaxID=68277 RepID=UPI00380DC581
MSGPPTRLVTTWAAPGREGRGEGNSRVTFEIRSHEDIVRLTVVHEDLADEGERADGASGRPAVLSDRESLLLSNLMSLLETGRTLPQEPWLVPSR